MTQIEKLLILFILIFGFCGSAVASPAKLYVRPTNAITSTYHRISPSRGVWSGRVEGSGSIGLRLIIYRNGIVQSNRHMGKVRLNRTNSSSFTFNTPVPSDDSWSWRLLAEQYL